MPELEQPSGNNPASATEQVVAYRFLGACMHRIWTRTAERYARYAQCVRCGERMFLSGNLVPELADMQVVDLWLKRLPRPASDEAVASIVVRKLEEEGWLVRTFPSGASIRCVLEKGDVRIESSSQAVRAAAINEAAARAAGDSYVSMLAWNNEPGVSGEDAPTTQRPGA